MFSLHRPLLKPSFLKWARGSLSVWHVIHLLIFQLLRSKAGPGKEVVVKSAVTSRVGLGQRPAWVGQVAGWVVEQAPAAPPTGLASTAKRLLGLHRTLLQGRMSQAAKRFSTQGSGGQLWLLPAMKSWESSLSSCL